MHNKIMKMKSDKYKDFSVTEFMEDEHFIKWALNEDETHDLFWESFFNTYPRQRTPANEARELLRQIHGTFDTEVNRVSRPVESLEGVFKELMDERSEIPKFKKTKKRRFYGLAYASILAVLIACTYFFLITGNQDKIKYVTRHGEWKTIELPDGSQVALNANSQLIFQNTWVEGKDRLVWLKGEAFFEVEKKPQTNAKFSVITKDLSIQVLGTSFNVNTRNRQTEVFLEEGNVTLDMGNEQACIVPGEFLAYSQEKKKITKRYKKTEDIQSFWKDGVLKIEEASMRKILNEIEVIYGVDIVVNNIAVFEKEGTIAIPVDNIEIAIPILERVLHVKIRKKMNQLFIE